MTDIVDPAASGAPETVTPALDNAAAITPGAPLPDWAQQLEQAVAAWLAEEIHNSPIARVTDAYNHLVTALSGLKARILQHVATATTTPEV
ncbi:MAG: hypothetical protein PW843_03320 [Azospirillaceae bacterium]|nr:hypothetical protein [Azospirillaceae bacterium]